MEVGGVTVILLFSWSMCTAHQAITKSTFCSCSISYTLHNKNVHIFPPATLTMMTPHQSVLTLVLTVIVLALPSTGTILTVQPNSTTPCDNEPCFTLSEYVQNGSKYFNTSNITLQFLPGNHTLDSNLTIADIQHLNILGSGSSPTPSRVGCTGSNVGFEFRNISEVRVRDMTFTSCERSHTIYFRRSKLEKSAYYAVRFESVQHIEVIDCVFHDNHDTALGIFNSSAVFSGNNKFSSNCRRCPNSIGCLAYTGCFGGGIYVEASEANFSGIAIFDRNSGSYGGGIYARYNSDVSFSGNASFKKNSATLGGGIYAQSNSDVSFSGNTSFKENSAYGGGGIYAWDNSDVSFSGNTSFKENSARYVGGGIFAYRNSDVSFSGTGTISDNIAREGGGIWSYSSTIELTGNIRNNTAEQYGGGIYMRRTNLSLAGTNNFTDNSAREGGGIYAAENSNLDFDGVNTFDTNRAGIRGGGIWMDNGNLILNGNNSIVRCTAGTEGGGISLYNVTINLPGNNKFTSNSATSGAGISARWSRFSFTNSSHFSNNSAADTGGGISTSISTLAFSGKITFDNNFADLGGGIYMMNSSVDFFGKNYFKLNHARRDGGGIYGRGDCTVNLSGFNNFYDNEAEMGGGMFIEDGRLSLSGSSLFHNNKGTTGGGLYSFKSGLEFYGVYNFTANSVLNAGGGFFTAYSTVVLAGNTTFEGNSALTGGAMYMEDTQVNMTGTSHFSHDSARHEGGAIYIQGGKMNISGENLFEHNSAAMRGGALFAACTTINFTGITIICNSTSPEGAAIHGVSSSIIFEGKTQFQNNFAQYGGAMFSENSNFTFGKNKKAKLCHHCRTFPGFDSEPGSSFISNSAVCDGAMHLDHQSSMYIHPLACMLFENNTANEYGGAIYVVDITGNSTCPPVLDLPSRNECFVYMISDEISEPGRINLTFQGNIAGKRGSVLYGGMLNKCNNSYLEENALHLFNSSIKDGTKIVAISSDPMLCFCTEGGPHDHECDEEKSMNAFPGQNVNVSVIAVDQTDTPIKAAIHTDLISDEKHNSKVCETFSQEREGYALTEVTPSHLQTPPVSFCSTLLLSLAAPLQLFSTLHF